MSGYEGLSSVTNHEMSPDVLESFLAPHFANDWGIVAKSALSVVYRQLPIGNIADNLYCNGAKNVLKLLLRNICQTDAFIKATNGFESDEKKNEN